MPEEVQLVSLSPDDMVKGGLLDDVDVEVLHAQVKVWDYDPLDTGHGTLGIETLALRLDMKELASGEESFQMWSIGDTGQFAPYDTEDRDGVGIKMIGDRSALVETSNFGILSASLVECGFPRDKLKPGRVDILDGLQMHVIRQAAPKRKGLGSEREGRESTILLCQNIIKLPWDRKKKGAAKKAASRKAAGGKAPESASGSGPISSDVNDATMSMLVSILDQKGGTIAMKSVKAAGLSVIVREKLTTDAGARKQILQLATDEEWLTENGFTVSDGSVSLG